VGNLHSLSPSGRGRAGFERLGAGRPFPSEFGSQTERAVETFLILAFPLLDDPEVEARIRSIAEAAALEAVERERRRR
jgi:hypothetical protein